MVGNGSTVSTGSHPVDKNSSRGAQGTGAATWCATCDIDALLLTERVGEFASELVLIGHRASLLTAAPASPRSRRAASCLVIDFMALLDAGAEAGPRSTTALSGGPPRHS